MDEDETTDDFNFWPSFSDVMLITVLIIILVMAFVQIEALKANARLGELNKEHISIRDSLRSFQNIHERELMLLSQVREKQESVTKEIARSYGGTLRPISVEKTYGDTAYDLIKNDRVELSIYYKDLLQRITFSDKILFETNDYALKAEGLDVLQRVGKALKQKLDVIERIQIEGHTDDRPTGRYGPGGNLKLGALRAISVYQYLQNDPIGVDPSRFSMSANSFGEFSPIDTANADSSRSKNRRIELLLFYRGQ